MYIISCLPLGSNVVYFRYSKHYIWQQARTQLNYVFITVLEQVTVELHNKNEQQ